MFNPFSYIASKVRAAVVEGFTAGLEDIGAFQDNQPGNPLEALRGRIQSIADKQPQAQPEETETTRSKRKSA